MVAVTDGTEYSHEYTEFPLTRTNSYDSSTCSEPDGDNLKLIDYKGDLLSCSSSPFKYCLNVLSFQSSDTSLAGTYLFEPLGFTFLVSDTVPEDPAALMAELDAWLEEQALLEAEEVSAASSLAG
jgi:hypothetical protein